MTNAGNKRISDERLALYGIEPCASLPAVQEETLESEPMREQVEMCLAGISRGETEALEKLYRLLKNGVYGLALAILKNRDEAEDVMQDTFLKVWRAAGQHRMGADGKAWVLTIARNLARERLRRKKVAAGVEPCDGLPVSDSVEQVNDRICLQQMFAVLDETERQIVVLYAVDGYLHKEIAQVLGKPYATVRWKFRRAIEKLAKALPDKEP